MAKKNDCWGIEVGSNAIKAVRLIGDGADVTLADYTVIPFKQILTTPDLDVEEQIQVGLDELLATRDLSKSTVVVSVPGHMAFARFAKLPPVEPKKVPDIVKFEAVQQVPFPIEQVEWDYQVFSQADSPDLSVGIFAITKDKVADFLRNFKQVGVNVDGLTLSPLGVFNAFEYDKRQAEDNEGVIVVDIGTTSTDVIINEGGAMWLRTLPIGGNNFTEALVRAFKLSYPKAEKLKREAATSKYAKKILTAMRPVYAELVQEIQRSLGYYQSLNQEASLGQLIGVGSTFRLPALQKFLKQELQLEIVRPEGFDRIGVGGKQESAFTVDAVNLATAYGLAIQGLGLESVSANVLPRHLVRQQLWREKQRWFAAAAAMIVLPVLLMWGNLLRVEGEVKSAAQETKAKMKQVVPKAEGYVMELEELSEDKGDLEAIENLSRLLDYRDVWPKLMQDLNMATLALQPQEVLTKSHYPDWEQIPRAERRRVFIESIEAEYKYATGDEMEGLKGSKKKGKKRKAKKKKGKKLGANNRSGGGSSVDPGLPGHIHITVTGLTTLQPGAARELSDHVIGWLKSHSDQPDRPYRIEVLDEDFYVEPALDAKGIRRRDSSSSQRTRRTSRSRSSAMGRSTRVDPMAGRIGGPAAMGGMMGFPGAPPMGGPVSGGRGSVDRSTVDDLYPKRPFSDESRTTDSRFKIVLIAKLVGPDDARKAETGERTTGKPIKGGTQAKAEVRP